MVHVLEQGINVKMIMRANCDSRSQYDTLHGPVCTCWHSLCYYSHSWTVSLFKSLSARRRFWAGCWILNDVWKIRIFMGGRWNDYEG